MSHSFLLMIVVFFVLALMRVPLSLAMIGSSVVYFIVTGQDLGLIADQMMNSLMSSYVMLAVPMFILAANIMNAATISDRLWAAANAIVGRAQGGLAYVSVLLLIVSSSMTGSAIADASGAGMMSVRMMKKVGGYPRGFAAAVVAAGSTAASAIPPAIPLVIYALISGASVGALFLGGLLPGILMGAALMAVIYFLAPRMNLPRGEAVPRRDLPKVFAQAIIPMTLPVVLLGGIWAGIFTPTEAAAVAGGYALLLGMFVYRALNPKVLFAVFAESSRASAVVMLLIAGAYVTNYVVTAEGLDRMFLAWIQSLGLGPVGFFLTVNVLLLAMGMLFDTGVLLLVVIPILMPTVKALGIDLVHIGVVIVINLMIGLSMPPHGMLLFVLSAHSKTPVGEIFKAILPFIAALLAVLLLMTLVPQTVLWLPQLFGY
jgi:tripartite ATP-independent transporter DctM subunit